MIKTVVVNDNGKLVDILQFEVPTEEFDLKQAIHGACLEYCKTEEGWKKYSQCKVFDVKAFLAYVPEVICKKHRFRRIREPEACMVMEPDDQILTEQDMEICQQYFQEEKAKEYNTSEITAWFARMWGIMETLGNLPQQNFKETAELLISWAEEFVRKGERDPILFFQRKIEIEEKAGYR